MPTITTNDGASLFYRDRGDGSTVLFCAAWALSSVEWEYQMTHLHERGMRTIAYDRRGHGRSDDLGDRYDYDALADDLATILDRLDLSQVTLVGHSMGAGEIIRYLTNHGAARVKRVALIAPTLPFLLKTETNPLGLDKALFEGAWAQWLQDFGYWIEQSEPLYFGDGLLDYSPSPLLRQWTRNDMLASSLNAVLEFSRSGVETDFREELKSIEVPVLIIHGDHDASAPLEITGRPTAELLPNAKLTVYENAPHGLYLTHRGRLNADLLAFTRQDTPVAALLEPH